MLGNCAFNLHSLPSVLQHQVQRKFGLDTHHAMLTKFVQCALLVTLLIGSNPSSSKADGKVIAPRNYAGSLEERSQEAIIIFHSSEEPAEAKEDLVLKIQVDGRATQFAWVIPFPNQPEVGKEDPALFRELFQYVEMRTTRGVSKGEKSVGLAKSAVAPKPEVEVLSRQVVGNFDVAVVRENEQGGLNPWLDKEGFQKLDNADDVLKFYREKKYVFACIKVSSEALEKQGSIESHPLRFTFRTGGQDGAYFPMKITGLQKDPFNVNLYVFHRFWLNDKVSKYGYEHRGFSLNYRDWDTKECEPNGGKQYTLPSEDPFLKHHANLFPSVTKLLQKLHPGEKYYLTNIKAMNQKPEDVRVWADDLWMFPYYTNRSFVPHDARAGGVAAAGWSAN